MTTIESLSAKVKQHCGDMLMSATVNLRQLTLEVNATNSYALLTQLRDHPDFQCNVLIDICGVDYLNYGIYEWDTEQASAEGFSRGVEPLARRDTTEGSNDNKRFAVVYHLLSTTLNHRIRIRIPAIDSQLIVDSVIDIWPAANWFEREAYDLYGILFKGHPDLRRILTDYGFVGHPFRKDFPVSGYVEMRYDAKAAKVVYEPVDIEPRTLVPKVSRSDNHNPSIKERSHG